MKSLLILSNISIENANAISGLTYGFPAITHFLGFSHSLSRELHSSHGITLGKVAVICHQHQLRTHTSLWQNNLFSLTKNPLTKEGKIAPFNEEGKIHLKISLLIECDFTINDLDMNGADNSEDRKLFCRHVERVSEKKRLAGGIITHIKNISFVDLKEDYEGRQKDIKKQLRKLLPGFVIMDRTDLLAKYQNEHSTLDPLESILDFYTLKFQAKEISEHNDSDKQKNWHQLPKPQKGWLVPIQAGYKAISKLFEPREVSKTRDFKTPFRFVEAIYTLGEWRGLHRVTKHEELFWQYSHENEYYLSKTQ